MRKILLPLIALLLNACSYDKVQVISGKTMATSYSIKSVGPHLEQAKIDARLAEINQVFSTWNENSEISKLNQAPIKTWIKISDDLFFVLAEAQKIAQQTQGFFDPGIGRLIDLWGFGVEKVSTPPDNVRIQSALDGASIKHLQLRGGQVKKLKDVALNLSAIAKGFAVDEIAKLLINQGVKRFLVEIGGEVISRGKGWRVGLEMPNHNAPILLKLNNQAVATSGNYRHYFVWQGRNYPHILNPHTGLPAISDLSAVSVIHDSTLSADAIATAIMVMGSKKATILANRLNLQLIMILDKAQHYKILRVNS